LAQLGAEAKEMDTLLRMEYLEPAHDLRPAFQQLRGMMSSIAARKTDLGRGAAAYAMGKGHQWLGAWEASRKALDDAHRFGVHGPDWEEAMGFVLGRLYERGLGRVKDLAQGGGKAAAIAELQRELRDPAVRHLNAAAMAKPGSADLLRGYVALYEERIEDGLRDAGRAKEGRPGLYEASVLQGELYLSKQFSEEQAGRLAESLAAADLAEEALADALKVGRSDPKPWLLLARSRELRLGVMMNLAKPGQRWAELALEAASKALNLNPSLPDAWLAHGRVLVESARYLRTRGRDSLKIYRESEADLRRAAELTEDRRLVQEEIAWVCMNLADDLDQGGEKREAEAAIQRGLVAAKAALDLDARSLSAEKRMAQLLFRQGESTRERGQDPLNLYEDAARHGEAAIALDPEAIGPRLILPIILVRCGRFRGERGSPFEPAFRRAGDLVTWANQHSPGNVQVLATGLWVYRLWASELDSRGLDAKEPLALGWKALEELERKDPRNPNTWALAADFSVVSASNAATQGRELWSDLKSVRSAAAKALSLQSNLSSVHDALARSYLLEARWHVDQRRSPRVAIAHLQKEIAKARAINPLTPFWEMKLAEGALLEAEWRRSNHEPYAELLKRAEMSLAPYLTDSTSAWTAFLLRGSMRAFRAMDQQGSERSALKAQAQEDLRKAEPHLPGSAEVAALKKRIAELG
jgi:tetratricopeptide (TPR) repeat protein